MSAGVHEMSACECLRVSSFKVTRLLDGDRSGKSVLATPDLPGKYVSVFEVTSCDTWNIFN